MTLVRRVALAVVVAASACAQPSRRPLSLPPEPKGSVALTGSVIDYYTQTPVIDAEVSATGTGGHFETHTGDFGRFSFRGIPEGTYDLKAAREGYESSCQTGMVFPPEPSGRPRVFGVHFVILPSNHPPFAPPPPPLLRRRDDRPGDVVGRYVDPDFDMDPPQPPSPSCVVVCCPSETRVSPAPAPAERGHRGDGG